MRAGTGRYAEHLRRLGAPRADACEHSRAARRLAARRGVEVLPFDRSGFTFKVDNEFPVGPSPLGYDVAFCLEVAGHVPPELGDRLVSYLARFPTVMFTAAHPHQGGTAHINEQPKEYWQTRFAQHGLARNGELEASFLSAAGDIPGGWLLENLTIFQAAEPRNPEPICIGRPGTVGATDERFPPPDVATKVAPLRASSKTDRSQRS